MTHLDVYSNCECEEDGADSHEEGGDHGQGQLLHQVTGHLGAGHLRTPATVRHSRTGGQVTWGHQSLSTTTCDDC